MGTKHFILAMFLFISDVEKFHLSDVGTLSFIFTMFGRALTFRLPPSSPPSRREHVLDVELTETSTSGGKKL